MSLSCKRWHQNEQYWIDSYPFIFSGLAWLEAEREIIFLLGECDLSGNRCLDLCCGAGRHAAQLAKRGLQTTAVDSSKYLISKARKKSKGLNVKYLRRDLEKRFALGCFDLVLNLNSSFGQFSSDRANKKFLLKMANAVAQRGYLAIHCLTRAIVSRDFQPRKKYFFRNGLVACERTKNRICSRVTGVWKFVRPRVKSSYIVNYRLYDSTWFTQILAHSGFEDIKCYGDFDGRGYGNSSSDMIIIARKAA